ncbi:DUF4214 domain-containing protein [Halomonas sp. WWR20]
MATQASENFVQQLYVAYYGRPADSAGLQYWAERADEQGQGAIVNAFGESQEFQEEFGDLSNEALVNNLYQQLFSRDADESGLAYYTGVLESGEKSLSEIALTISNAAQGSDMEVRDARVEAADAYTAKAGDNYDVDVAQNLLQGIDATDTQADLEAALAQVENLPTQSGGDGQTFTLTAGADQLTGTAGDDTFLATGLSLSSLDTIDGGAGVDTLRIEANAVGNTGYPELTSIEAVEIVGASAGSLNNVNVNELSADLETLNFTRVDEGAPLTVSGLTEAQTVNVTQRDTDGNGTLATSTVTTNVANGSTVKLGVNASNVALTTAVAASNSADAVDTLNLTTTGESTVAVTNAADLRTVTVNASDELDLTLANLGDTGSVEEDGAVTVDASASTGDIDLDLAGSDQVSSVTLGAGDDTLSAADVDLSDGDVTLAGGEGRDTLTLASTQDVTNLYNANSATVSGFEVLDISGLSGTLNNGTLTNAGFEALEISDADGGTVEGLTEETSVTLQDSDFKAGVTADPSATPPVVGVAESGRDTITLDVNGAADDDDASFGFTVMGRDGANAGYDVTVDEVENVSVQTVDADADTYQMTDLDLSADAVKTLSISGAEAVSFNGSSLTTLESIDLSGVTADSDADAGEYASEILGLEDGVSVTGSANADKISAAIDGEVEAGAGDDYINVDNSATVTGGEGDDTFNLSTYTNDVSATNFATITDFEEGDVIDFGTAVDGFEETTVTTAPGVTATFQDYLDEAASGSTVGQVNYFEFDGNSYLVQDNAAGATFSATDGDLLVELTGSVDLTGLQAVSNGSSQVEIA